MFRSTIRRIRRTLSFRSKKKKQGDGSTSGAAGGGSNQNWENDANNIKNGGCTFEVKVRPHFVILSKPGLFLPLPPLFYFEGVTIWGVKHTIP